jgi:glycosyltransferase involved in cell wall biosynthesis
MRLLHVGTGFRPFRRGGLVAYVEDLMNAQAAAGHEVSYFFSGRHYRGIRGPRLKRWRRPAVAMLEIVNSPLDDHGRQPELEVSEPRIERILARVLEEVRPDVVHVQELAGLPFSLLDVAREHGCPVVMTLQDYFPLCSTFKLFDAAGEVCTRSEIGADCAATIAAQPSDPALLYEATLRFDLDRQRPMQRIPPATRDRVVSPLASGLARVGGRRRRPDPPRPEAFQRRREANIERLNSVDCLIAMSDRLGSIYAGLGVDAARIRTMQLTLEHIERLQPRRAAPSAPLIFGTLGGGESPAKGSRLLLAAMRSLQDEVRTGRLRLVVFGYVEPEFASRAAQLAGIDMPGMYPPAELGSLLEPVDVGIMPSIWEEAYGYAGVEFLAKGIPVIGNRIGGIPEYVLDHETGWLNEGRSGAGLAAIMRELATHPERVSAMAARVRARRAEIVKPLAEHVADLEAVYATATGGSAKESR